MDILNLDFILGMLLLVSIIIIASVILIHHFKKKIRTETTMRQQIKIATQTKESSEEDTFNKQPIPCKSVSLTVRSTDISSLKEQGSAFSAALLEQALYLQDRIVFNGISIAATQIEPDGPAVITADTAVKIKGTEDPIILHCPSCGEVQEEMGTTCTKCKGELPVVML